MCRDKNEFMEAIRSYAGHAGRNLKFFKNDSDNGKYEGELWTNVARDPNDHMLPMTYAIVEVENKETWTWFLELLIEDLGGSEDSVPTISKLLPRAEHKFCMRHLYANFRKRFSGQTLKNLMWKTATSTYPQAWEREMLSIKEVNVDAYKYLIAIPPRYRFTGWAVCDILNNNMSEAFNSVIVDARGKPIIIMLEEIRFYLLKRWATNIIKMCIMDFDICPKIIKKLTKESNLSKNWIPNWFGEKMFKVRHFAVTTNKFAINLNRQAVPTGNGSLVASLTAMQLQPQSS
ncbi:uncharacterized protein LOC108346492 [Vigna angularis]|uniref:uncharacterized protein LOC108346492 n=1 Tax=Phaseolus angularis TaxID=3914 RepID=UPI00080A5433|nr:uncharacterized protein LOC108346492 [Vigna angularis]